MIDLPLIWAILIAFAVFAYVVLDGFDLGIGILFPLFGERRDRDTMMNTVAPVWDGNETWLVLGGGGLFAAFPLAYSILLPALYAPLTAMLLALIFRGVAFEFRFRAGRERPLWDIAFITGSYVATFAQGLVLGTFVEGFAVEGRAYAGGWLDWLSPFSVMTGCALLAGYGLLGATWLLIKTEGELQERCFGYARPLAFAVVGFIAAVSLWSPLLSPQIAARWFSLPNLLLLSPVPLLVAGLILLLARALVRRNESRPFLLSLGLFLLSYIGIAISLYPYIVPRAVTFREAAAPDASLGFLLVGAAVLIPIILGYTAYAYRVFRGKVSGGEGYH